ncbi:MAG: NepR family anti-sigma factor [Sphingomicrobium sp.]
MSGRQSESDSIGKRTIPTAKSAKDGSADGAVPREKGARKSRSADLGRALRSVYDDTLRESVPDDFLDLLGKLK